LELLPAFADTECYRGPCYDYTACVTEKCNLHVGCLVNTIAQFWARTYHAATVNPLAVAADAVAGVKGAARLALGALTQVGAQLDLVAPVLEGVTEGCPPGTRWAVGLTGYSCQSPATHPVAATRAELVAAGILRS
jgi:hypothetical protein